MTPPTSGGDSKGLLVFVGGILATIAVVVGLVLLWPSSDGDDDVTAGEDTTTTSAGDTDTTSADGGVGEPSEQTTTTTTDPEPVNLFAAGATDAIADISAAAGDPTQVIEIAIYDTYAFLAYRDPAHPANIDRRQWRDGAVDDADKNPIDDRVNGDTEPSLFKLANIDLDVLPPVTADAPSRFDLDVAVTHVIIDRFLPFDQRVLIRVYASPSDGRSGGGYVQYTVAGEFVKVIQ